MKGGDLNQPVADYEYRELGRMLDPAASPAPVWGCFIHPDEVRSVYMVGNSRLETSSGEQITNDTLKHWIDLTVRAIGDYLEHDIYPVLRRHRLPGSFNREIEDFAQYEDLAKHHANKRSCIHQLQRRPLARLHSWELITYDARLIIDLTNYAMPIHSQGLLKTGIWPGIGGSGATFHRGGMAAGGSQHLGIQTNDYLMYAADYTSGYDHASRVPRELKTRIIDQLIIEVSSAWGEGVAGGLAGSSLSVGPLHESVQTTMSSTSAWSGARIGEKVAANQRWDRANLLRYRGIKFGSI